MTLVISRFMIMCPPQSAILLCGVLYIYAMKMREIRVLNLSEQILSFFLSLIIFNFSSISISKGFMMGDIRR
ncbi:hypothetical protein I7I53_09053 [Histoplasma capsulatum var. duboisii H88]|uniref:Uncharacterized protein n=1 Tax=Ajellomyces capsulatus (strain H88) TaxID=544711 RepID=A0A8A1L8V1_AJEC8|nr:hypothetical protein I7I53_09053 [Histoplasma capsulatum var. duboisii H88]